jgi:tetratricopeptide (TPR) repeat protein
MANRKKVSFQSSDPPGERLHTTRWRVGDLIRDRYEVYDIKTGGIGVVYIVYDHDHGIPYALKTLQDRYLSNPLAVNRLTQEAEVWLRLGRHPNIVNVVCVDQIDDQPYIVLECIVGPSLREALSRGPLARRTVLIYAIQFCRGMVHAQEKIPEFAHLDIKPENCMVTQDGVLKVTDFSLSRALLEMHPRPGGRPRGGVSAPGQSKTMAGTSPYMSPEQWVDFERAGRHSDMYSFGVMLYEMLTGKRPFHVKTARQWRHVHLKETPAAPRTIIPSIPRTLNDLTMRCLRKTPEERPDDFLGIMNSLETILREEFHEETPTSSPEELEGWEYSNMGVSLCHLGRVREAISCYDRALFRNPKDPYAWLNKGVAVGTLGDGFEELECYGTALALSPDFSEAWYNKGLALYKLGRFEEAVSCYDRSLATNPHQTEVWVNKGSALGGLGQPEEEVLCYEKAIAIEPNHARAWIGKAVVSMNLGQYEEANTYCDRALAIASGMAEAWVNKASALGALGRFNEAIGCCEKALVIDPHLCEAWVCKGLASGGLERLEDEVFCYEKALAINANHPEAWYRKGVSLSNMKRFEAAIACYDRALSINPKDSEIWVKKGMALSGLGCFDRAVSCYEEALKNDSGDANSRYNKRLVLYRLGDSGLSSGDE